METLKCVEVKHEEGSREVEVFLIRNPNSDEEGWIMGRVLRQKEDLSPSARLLGKQRVKDAQKSFFPFSYILRESKAQKLEKGHNPQKCPHPFWMSVYDENRPDDGVIKVLNQTLHGKSDDEDPEFADVTDIVCFCGGATKGSVVIANCREPNCLAQCRDCAVQKGKEHFQEESVVFEGGKCVFYPPCMQCGKILEGCYDE